MSYESLKLLVMDVEYHHIRYGTRWTDFKISEDIEELSHNSGFDLTDDEKGLLNNIINTNTQGWSIVEDLREAQRLEIENINREGRADKTYTLAFVGETLWGCVPDGEEPLGKVRSELGDEFCDQFNPSDITVHRGITLTNSKLLTRSGRLIYTCGKKCVLVDTDGRTYKYAVALS